MSRSSLNLSKDHVNSAVITDYSYADILIKDKFDNLVRVVDMESKARYLPGKVHVYLKNRRKLGIITVQFEPKTIEIVQVKQQDKRSQNALHLAKAFIERHVLK